VIAHEPPTVTEVDPGGEIYLKLGNGVDELQLKVSDLVPDPILLDDARD
jgi:hypothetical protein